MHDVIPDLIAVRKNEVIKHRKARQSVEKTRKKDIQYSINKEKRKTHEQLTHAQLIMTLLLWRFFVKKKKQQVVAKTAGALLAITRGGLPLCPIRKSRARA
jgi:hypothetical protein